MRVSLPTPPPHPLTEGFEDMLELVRQVCTADVAQLVLHDPPLRLFRVGRARPTAGPRVAASAKVVGSQGQVFGSLQVVDWRPGGFDTGQVEGLRAVARLAATALELDRGLHAAALLATGTAGVEEEVVTVAEAERRAILAALSHACGNLSAAVRALQMGRTTLYRKLRLYGLDPGRPRRRRPGEAGSGAAPEAISRSGRTSPGRSRG